MKIIYGNKDEIDIGKLRNKGIYEAKGKYFMFVDVDDFIDENLLWNLVPYIEKNVDIIKYKMKIIKGNNSEKILGPVFDVVTGEEAFNKLCFEDKFLDSPCLYLIKKEYFENMNLKFAENMYHEDFGLIPLLIANASSVISTNIFGYMYMQTENSITRNKNYSKSILKVQHKIEHYKNMLNELEKMSLNLYTKDNIKIYYTNSVILSFKELNKNDRKKFVKQIKKLKMLSNLKNKSFKQLFRKIIIKTSIGLYLKLKKLK